MVSGTSSLYISTAGNVGIGTSSPSAKLHIYTDLSGTTSPTLLIQSEATSVGASSSALLRIVSNVSTTSNAVFNVDAAGNYWYDGTGGSPAADYAEYFSTVDTDLASGEVVCVDTATPNAIKRCRGFADNDVMGIVSTKPAIVGNRQDKFVDNANYKIIAMLGQIPARASAENGAIRPGDSLTSAKLMGYVARANAGDPTVGVALESLETGEGTINVLISRRNKSLTVEQVEQSVTDRVAAMKIEDEVRVMISSAVNSLSLNTQITPIVNEQLALLKSGLTVTEDEQNNRLIQLTSSLADLAGRLSVLERSVNDQAAQISNFQLSISNQVQNLNNQIASSTILSSNNIKIDENGHIKLGNNIATSTVAGATSTPVVVNNVAIVEISALSDTPALVVRQAGSGKIAEFQGPEVSVMTVEGAGEVKVVGSLDVDGRILVCSGGVCPAGLDSSVDSTLGDVGVEGKVVAGAFASYCEDGFTWMPGSAKYGTMPGFCVSSRIARYTDLMQTNAGLTPTIAGITDASSTPWVNISQGEAAVACQSLGDNYHLLSENEWLTIAENILRVTANDTDSLSVGMQLATTSAFTLTTGAQIYDLVGSLSQWTDQTVTRAGLPTVAMSTVSSLNDWKNYSEIEDFKGLNITPAYYFGPANNIGGLLLGDNTNNLRGFVRGQGGLYSLNLSNAPTMQSPTVGFRCAK